jgi:hypothetical protein
MRPDGFATVVTTISRQFVTSPWRQVAIAQGFPVGGLTGFSSPARVCRAGQQHPGSRRGGRRAVQSSRPFSGPSQTEPWTVPLPEHQSQSSFVQRTWLVQVPLGRRFNRQSNGLPHCAFQPSQQLPPASGLAPAGVTVESEFDPPMSSRRPISKAGW